MSAVRPRLEAGQQLIIPQPLRHLPTLAARAPPGVHPAVGGSAAAAAGAPRRSRGPSARTVAVALSPAADSGASHRLALATALL